MNHFCLSEANLAAPAKEISRREIECIAKLDQHIERHHKPKSILAPCVIDEVFYDDKRSAWRQGVVGCTDQVHFLFQVPVVEDHAHGDHIGVWQWVREEIDGLRCNSITKT